MNDGQQRATWRPLLLAGLALAALGGFFLGPPIVQDPAYHHFADTRGWLGVPHFGDVVSNLPFALVGLAGLGRVRRERARLPWAVFFAGLLLVAAGSAYYHWAPDDDRLVWDRLPMTVGFIGLTVALLVEHVHPRALLLLPLGLALGLGSVGVWVATGDLRLYAGVQLMPLVVASAVLALYRASYTRAWYLGVGVALYALAKLCEAHDADLFAALPLSGHTLKHLLGAGATLSVLEMLRRRAPRPTH